MKKLLAHLNRHGNTSKSLWDWTKDTTSIHVCCGHSRQGVVGKKWEVKLVCGLESDEGLRTICGYRVDLRTRTIACRIGFGWLRGRLPKA